MNSENESSLRFLIRSYGKGKLAMQYLPATATSDLNGNGEVEPLEWTKQCPCFEVKREKW